LRETIVVGRVPTRISDRAGLPVGMQVVVAEYEDRTAVDVARRMAEVVGGFERSPGFA
jgi:amidase